MRLLDLCCGAGGAAMGYHRAGFDEIIGVDLKPQPRYPFMFVRGDALEYPLEGFDAVHASPPCQRFTSAQTIRGREHPDLLTPMRERLVASGLPWVIENVLKAPMRPDVILCGTAFGLETKRHRQFEVYDGLIGCIEQPECRCEDPAHTWKYGRPIGVYGHTGTKRTGNTSGNHGFLVAHWREALGIDWMSRNELAQAIPPAYTEYIGRALLHHLRERAAR